MVSKVKGDGHPGREKRGFDRYSAAGRSLLQDLRLSFESWEGNAMAKRFKLPARRSKKMFSKAASRTHKKNMPAPRKVPMRGGIRM